MVSKVAMYLFVWSAFFISPGVAGERTEQPSIMVTAFSDSKFSKIEVSFSKLENTPGDEEFSPGDDVRVVTFKAGGAALEERAFNFVNYDGSLLCNKKQKKLGKCLNKKLVIFMKSDPAVSRIKFFHGKKEVASVKVPQGLLEYKVSR